MKNHIDAKKQEAIDLAKKYYELEQEQQIYHITCPRDNLEDEPFKILCVNQNAIPGNDIEFFQFRPDKVNWHHSYMCAEVTPTTFYKIKNGILQLPEDWSLGEPIPNNMFPEVKLNHKTIRYKQKTDKTYFQDILIDTFFVSEKCLYFKYSTDCAVNIYGGGIRCFNDECVKQAKITIEVEV